jgi:hypothetical protein
LTCHRFGYKIIDVSTTRYAIGVAIVTNHEGRFPAAELHSSPSTSSSTMTATYDVDEFDVLSAAWILACNDENPIVTYDGLKHRLSLPSSYDIRSLIAKRGELFRKGVSDDRLQQWKKEMLSGKGVPSWIKVLDSEVDRRKKINEISAHDVFRSQFRTSKENADKSPIEIINWGLQHIDRLRKAKLESKDVSAKQWQVWLVFATAVVGVVVQIIIAVYFKGK